MGGEYTGMTEEEYDAMYPNGVPDGHADDGLDQGQDTDVDTGSSPADFEGPGGHADESVQQGEPQEPDRESETQDAGIDERGVPWKNKAKELERKLAALEARQQQPPATEPPPELPPQAELPPQLPPQQQYPQQSQQQPQAQTKSSPTTYDEFIALAEQRAEQRAMQVIQRQQTEQRILSDYPDIANPQSPLFQWTQYELNTRYGNDPRFVEEAAMRAAARIGVQAKSRQVAQPQPKPLPKVTANPPAAERGTPARQQRKEPKLSERQAKVAQIFGQKPADVATMMKKKNYAYANGQSVFEE